MTGERKAEGRNRDRDRQWRQSQSCGWLWNQFWNGCQGPFHIPFFPASWALSAKTGLTMSTDGLMLRAGTLVKSEYVAFRWPWNLNFVLIFTLDLRQGGTNTVVDGHVQSQSSGQWVVAWQGKVSTSSGCPGWLCERSLQNTPTSRQFSRPPRPNCYISRITTCHTVQNLILLEDIGHHSADQFNLHHL